MRNHSRLKVLSEPQRPIIICSHFLSAGILFSSDNLKIDLYVVAILVFGQEKTFTAWLTPIRWHASRDLCRSPDSVEAPDSDETKQAKTASTTSTCWKELALSASLNLLALELKRLQNIEI